MGDGWRHRAAVSLWSCDLDPARDRPRRSRRGRVSEVASSVSGLTLTLNTWSKPKPGTDGQELAEHRHLEATGDDYDQAYAAVVAQLPAGWTMIGISRWPQPR